MKILGLGNPCPSPAAPPGRGRGTGGSSHLEAAPFSQPYPSVKMLLVTNPARFEFTGIHVLKELIVRTSVNALSSGVLYALNILLAGFSSLLQDNGLILSFAFCNKSLFFFHTFTKSLTDLGTLSILLKSALELSLHFRMAETQQTKLQ